MEPTAGEIAATNSELTSELTNDIVTVSKLQIALRSSAIGLQTQLSELAAKANTRTDAGLFELAQRSVTLLLNQSQHWSHLLASSQTVPNLDEAEALFAQLSDQERQKFSTETLSNVDGIVQRRPISLPQPHEKPAYVVVTLLFGTADDRPIFGTIQSVGELRQVLQQLREMPAPYLQVFEVLWTPQDVMDVLPEAEFAAEFGDLQPI